MCRLLVLAMLVAFAAAGQGVVDPARLSASMLDFDGGPTDRPLQCEVSPIRAELNFGFRFQAGYLVTVPMSQYFGRGHFWATLTRVTPEGDNQKPVYLSTRTRLPEVPVNNRSHVEFGGGFLLGEGRYRVSWKLTDDSGRVCRKTWKIEARLHRSENRVKVTLPASTVTDYSLRRVPVVNRDAEDVPKIRLTVLMHAAPAMARRMRISARDRLMLLGTLSSLMERLPVRSVRLVVFSLDKQKELYRDDNFSPQAMGRVSQSINAIELATVDYQVLQNRGGHVDLLADLIHGELTAEKPSDVVLFLGPLARFSDKVPSAELERPAPGPRFFYLQYRPNFPQPAAMPDVISRAVAKLHGKTLVIHTPGEFAKAIDQVERR